MKLRQGQDGHAAAQIFPQRNGGQGWYGLKPIGGGYDWFAAAA